MFIAVRTGLEPATPCVTGMYSNQLNYRTSVSLSIDVSRLRVQSYEQFLILQIFSPIIFAVSVTFLTINPLNAYSST